MVSNAMETFTQIYVVYFFSYLAANLIHKNENF